jgi:hypothetical protein
LPRVYFKHLWLPIIGLEVEKGFKLGWIILFISWKIILALRDYNLLI